MATRYQRGNQNLYIEEDDYPFGILWPLCRLLIFDIQILITHLVSCGHCVVCFSSIYRFSLPLLYLVAIVSSALLRYTDSDYPFGILWPLCRLLFFDLQILITPLVSSGHCVVCFKRYQSGNQNLYIEEEQTTQWPQDTKGVMRICISKRSRRHNGHKIPKG
jgi:hypothetical protein